LAIVWGDLVFFATSVYTAHDRQQHHGEDHAVEHCHADACRGLGTAPLASISGSHRNAVHRLVMSTGRSRIAAASITASRYSTPRFTQLVRELDDQMPFLAASPPA